MNNRVNLIYSALYHYTSLLATPGGLPVFNSVYYEFTAHSTVMCHLYMFMSTSTCHVLPCTNKDILRVFPWSARLSKLLHFPCTYDIPRLVQTYLDAL